MSDALAGKDTVIKAGGTPTALASEPTTKVTANTVYQVTNAAKRVLDPDTAIVVEVDADGGGGGGYVDADPDDFTVNYFTGTVTFFADQGVDAVVRIKSGKYVPLLTLATGRATSLSLSTDAIDQTKHGDQARNKLAGRKNLEGSLEVLEDLTTDIDPGGATLTFSGLIIAGTPAFLESQPGGSGPVFRAWVLFDKGDVKAAGNDAVVGTVNFTGLNRRATGTGRTEQVNRSWVTA